MALLLSFSVFFIYIHSTKENIVKSAIFEPNQSGISLSMQNPYIMPIKVFRTIMVDENDKELPITAYHVKLNGMYSGNGENIDQAFIQEQTDVFEELDEVTIPSDTSKNEEVYNIFITNHPKKKETFEAAGKVKVSFKVFSLIPFTTTITL